MKWTSELPICGLLLHVGGHHYRRLADQYLEKYATLPEQPPELADTSWKRLGNHIALKGESHDAHSLKDSTKPVDQFKLGKVFTDKEGRTFMLVGGCVCK